MSGFKMAEYSVNIEFLNKVAKVKLNESEEPSSNRDLVKSSRQENECVLKPTDKRNESNGNVSSSKMIECVCPICKKQFSCKRSLIRHTKIVHPKGTETIQKSTGSICPICDKHFKLGKHMLEHVRNIHKTTVLTENCGKLRCPLCQFSKHVHLESLRAHLLNQHKFSVETEEQSFETVEDFHQWKEDEEVRSKSKFVSYGRKKSSAGTKHYYRCHHTGSYTPQGSGKRLLQKQGSKKTGVTCSASIEMTKSSPVKVKYFKTHCGHDVKLKHLPLTENEKSTLAAKLAEGIPMQTILNDVHNGSYEELTRIQLLTRKDLWNIKQSFGLLCKEQANNSEVQQRTLSKSERKRKFCKINQTNRVPSSKNDNLNKTVVEVLNHVLLDNTVETSKHLNSEINKELVPPEEPVANGFKQQTVETQIPNIESDYSFPVIKDMLHLLRTKQEFKDIAFFVSESGDWIFLFSKTFKEKGHLTPNINIALHGDGTCVVSRQFVSEFSKVTPKDTERLTQLLRVIQEESVFCGEVPCDGMPLEFTYG